MANINDIQRGLQDAKYGIYDKFFRYNRNDDGAAYDKGWQQAVEQGTAYMYNETLNII